MAITTKQVIEHIIHGKIPLADLKRIRGACAKQIRSYNALDAKIEKIKAKAEEQIKALQASAASSTSWAEHTGATVKLMNRLTGKEVGLVKIDRVGHSGNYAFILAPNSKTEMRVPVSRLELI